MEELKEREKKELIDEGWFLVRAIFEMIGKPKEYLVEQMNEYINKIKQRSGVKISSYEIENPEEDEEKGFFSVYCESEILLKDLQSFSSFCLETLPSHIEILEPAKIQIDSLTLSTFFNELIIKLHGWDKTVRTVNEQNKVLYNNHSILVKNMIILALRFVKRTKEQLEKDIGLPLKAFWLQLNELIEKGIVKEEDGYLMLVRKTKETQESKENKQKNNIKPDQKQKDKKTEENKQKTHNRLN